jgi:16S rRNA (cytidine1402-2'-O)-methyltransferase
MTKFYIGATPIGGTEDITKRTLDVIRKADYIVCELIHVVKQTIEFGKWETNAEYIGYCYDFVGDSVGDRSPGEKNHGEVKEGIHEEILKLIQSGKTMIYLPERGSVGIEDPGLELRDFLESNGVDVELLPGVNSVTSSMLSSGLYTTPESNRAFTFQPLVDLDYDRMEAFISQYSKSPNMLIFQVHDEEMFDAISLMVKHYGRDRMISICMNVSLSDETIDRRTLGQVLDTFDIGKYKHHYTTIVLEGQRIPV